MIQVEYTVPRGETWCDCTVVGDVGGVTQHVEQVKIKKLRPSMKRERERQSLYYILYCIIIHSYYGHESMSRKSSMGM